jgi:hypothetical protein
MAEIHNFDAEEANMMHQVGLYLAEIQTTPIFSISAYYNDTSLGIAQRRIAAYLHQNPPYAAQLAALPAFIVFGVGTRSRHESTHHSDFDWIVMTANATPLPQRKAILAHWKAGGEHQIGFKPEDIRGVDSAGTPTELVDGAVGGSLLGPDLLLVYANHPDHTPAIMAEFHAAIVAKHAHYQAILHGGLSVEYDNEVLRRVDGTHVNPHTTVELKSQLRIFSSVAGRMALYLGEQPSYDLHTPFTADRLHHYLPSITGLSKPEVSELVLAYQELFTIRFLLHQLLNAEVNTLDGSKPVQLPLYQRWEKNVWPVLKTVLPKLHTALTNGHLPHV